MITDKLHNLKSSEYLKNILSLLTGVGSVQLLGLLVYPIYTRLFSPKEFAIFGIYLATVLIISTISTLKLENALLLPKKHSDAHQLLGIASKFALFTSLIVTVITIIAYFQKWQWLLIENNIQWCLFVPLGVLLISISKLLEQVFYRHKKFKISSKILVGQSTIVIIGNLSLGYFQFHSLGMIIAHLIGLLFYVVVGGIYFNNLKADKFNFKQGRLIIKEHNDFPKFLIISNFLNIASRELPIIIMNKFFPSPLVGKYSLTMRLMAVPRNLIAGPVMNVFYQKLAELNNGEASTEKHFLSNLKVLIVISTVICIPFYFLNDNFFIWVFGDQWTDVGKYSTLIVPWLFMVLIYSPLSSVLSVYKKLKWFLIYNIVLFSVRVILTLYWGEQNDIIYLITSLSWFNFILNLIMVIYFYFVIKKENA